MATAVALVIRLLITLAITADISFSNGSSFRSSTSSCIESEQQALLMFKHDLIDNTNRLISWIPDAEDCCKWTGVVCDNRTGHVLELHLGLPPFQGDVDTDYDSYWTSKLDGKINPCLSNLKLLRYLDLSNNEFEGKLPYQLGNLSNLQTLNLGDMGSVYVENLQWLSGFSLLKHLNLSMVNLGRVSNWLHVVNSLPSLEELSLSECELSLVPPFPSPKVNNLSLLTVLDLSFNYLGNDQLDFGWMSNLHSLAFLNLETNLVDGPIPDVFRNLSTSLRLLDLSGNHFNSFIPHWIYSLSDLEVLRIGGNHLQGEISIDIGNMTSLRHLDLSNNTLNSSIPDWIYSLSDLEVLKIGGNLLQGEISSGIGNMTLLNELDLSYNQLEGKLPTSMGSLCNLRSISLSGQKLSQSISHVFEILSTCFAHKLETLEMSGCHLFGEMTDQLGLFKNLTTLVLSNNSISGPIPTSMGQLANLVKVDLANNLLEGVVSELHFVNHTKLRYFVASDNSLLTLKVHPNWIPPFQLFDLELRSWHIGPSFPSWLLSQKHLEALDISNSNISDSIPPLFWRLSTHISKLNLSHNHIHGQFEYIPKNMTNYFLDLSFNCFSGPLPLLSVASSSIYSTIDLSNNYFSGSLFHPLCDQLNNTMVTNVLILSRNLLSGEIPDCWTMWPYLNVLKLDDNKFTGRIPVSMGTLLNLEILNLHRNNLHGEIPLSLKNCVELLSFNLGENQIEGNIPRWLGQSISFLMILILRSNKLSGNIPDDLCDQIALQILDLANNTLSGSIPRCINNFPVMAHRINSSSDVGLDFYSAYSETAFVMMKGQLLEYSKTLKLVRVVDFSSNNLSGEIPQEVTTLQALQSLNLSQNTLSGKIPKNIGAMQSLESLDLSQNQLTGSIPQSMSSMTFLSCLNLSYNNLTGEIPSSTQLQSFNPSSYIGNNLRGCPLEDCIERGKKPNSTRNGEDNITHAKRFKVNGLYISIALGFIVGFWSIMAPLVVSRRWRFTYYGFLEQMWWKLHDFFKV